MAVPVRQVVVGQRPRIAGTPARWHRSCADGRPCCPASSSGQYRVGRRVEVDRAGRRRAGAPPGRRAACRRSSVDQRVLGPRPGAGLVGPAAPQVDDDAAVHDDGATGAQLTPLGVGGERLPHRFEPGVDPPVDLVALDGGIVPPGVLVVVAVGRVVGVGGVAPVADQADTARGGGPARGAPACAGRHGPALAAAPDVGVGDGPSRARTASASSVVVPGSAPSRCSQVVVTDGRSASSWRSARRPTSATTCAGTSVGQRLEDAGDGREPGLVGDQQVAVGASGGA